MKANDAGVLQSEIADGVDVFVAEDPKALEQRQQFVRVEDDGAANRCVLRRVSMERFDDDRSAGLQRVVDAGGELAGANITEHDQIPLCGAEVELIVPQNVRLQRDAEPLRLRVRGSNGLVSGIKACNGPSLLSEVQRIAPLPHAHIERLTRCKPACHIHEKCVRLGVEPRRGRRQDPIPPFLLGLL